MTKSIQKQTGFSLIELMIVIAIIGILAGISIPSYNSYIYNSKMATALANATTLAGFEETYFYENDTYLAGTYSGTANTFTNALEWLPSGDKDLYKYVVKAGSCTGGIAKCYTITVSFIADSSISQTISRP